MALADDERWMRLALDEARLARAHDDVPVGCVIVSAEGEELGRGHDRRELDQDGTAHAEVVAIRAACAKVRRWRVDGATAYVTLEPCVMCAGALLSARVDRVVFAAPSPKAGALESLFQVGADPRLNHRFETCSGLLQDESAAELASFFAALRAQRRR